MIDIVESSILKDIGSYKNKLISLIICLDEFCELMFNNKSYTQDDVENLVYTQIFPYLYVDDTQTEVLSYLCFEVDIPKVLTRTIKDMKLIVWVYCHKKIMKYTKKGYLGTRVDILADMVERQLRNSNKFGIGNLHLDSVNYFFPQKEFYGKQIVFTIPDFKVKE